MRLTGKANNIYISNVVPNEHHNSIQPIIQKLGQLEDIEEELGIDLITLFKALKNGIWVKFYPLQYYEKETIEFAGKFYFGATFDFDKPIFRFYQREYKLKDYGKTWALTKEELE